MSPPLEGEPIRIFYVIDTLDRGGTQTALYHLVDKLPAHRYRQRIYCLNDSVNDDVLRKLQEAGAEVVVVGKWKLLFFVGLLRLYLDFRRLRPHVVQTYLSYGDLIGRVLARITGVPVLLSSIRARNLAKRSFLFHLDRLTMPWVRKVVFNSKLVIPFSLERESVSSKQVVYIPNGVERKLGPKGYFRKKLQIDTDIPVIGNVGRLDPQKGHIYLLVAFQRLLTSLSEARLILAGQGHLRDELDKEVAQRNLKEQVHFIGDCSDMGSFFSDIDLYVHSALFEGMPNAVMEAMAAGLPVVATDVDGTKELIVSGETGWLVPAEDPAKLAECMEYALMHSEEARHIGQAAARRMEDEFSVDKMARAYDRLYREELGLPR